MKNFLERMTFNTPDGGGGGGAPAPAAASDAGATPPSAGSSPAGTGTPPAPSAGSEPPADGGGPAAGGDFYKPQGLADHLLGKDQNETMDKMAKALDGYRARDAERGVPETPDAYGQFASDIPDTIKPHIETLAGDPLFGRVAAKALEMKIPVQAYQALTQEFVSVAHEMGMMEPIIDEAAEREALTPDSAKHLPAREQQQARERRMNDNYAFVDGLVEKGLSKDDAEFAKAMLGDSAKGHRFFETIRNLAGGGAGGGPAMGHGAPGGMSAEDSLRARAALPVNTAGHKEFNKASFDQLQADYQKHYGK